jgi:FkbM family methyltransferase
MNKEFSDLLNKVIPDKTFIIVDGGARNGTKEVPALHPFSCIYCFEPNPEEYNKLKTRSSDNSSKRGTIINYPAALVNGYNEETTLNVSLRPGATSTLLPNKDLLAHFRDDHFSELAEIVKQVKVPATNLENFMNNNTIKNIDLLKLDTQGNEYEILLSAGEMINNIEVIKAEVEFLALYKDQALFHDISKMLYQHDFELINLEWTEPCKRFHARSDLHRDSYRLVWGDAIFARTCYDFRKERLLPQALILAEMGYTDIAIYQIRNSPLLKSREKILIENYYVKKSNNRAFTFKGKIREFIESKFSVEIKRVDNEKQVVSMKKNN